MMIFVKAKPGAREEKVEKLSDTSYAVSVKEPPIKGKANKAIEKVLAQYFGIPLSRVEIVSGHTSKSKVAEIVI